MNAQPNTLAVLVIGAVIAVAAAITGVFKAVRFIAYLAFGLALIMPLSILRRKIAGDAVRVKRADGGGAIAA